MIYLLRHGEIDAGFGRRFIGQTDLPLNESGRRQAREWREALKGVPWKGVFCSDLARSRETAGIIGGRGGLSYPESPPGRYYDKFQVPKR